MSAIVSPDGSPLAAASGESDRLISAELDLSQATLREAERRHHHPAMREFWDTGLRIMAGEVIDARRHEPIAVRRTDVTIAAAQIDCSRGIERNLETMERLIAAARKAGSDVVAFPELSVTGARLEDIRAAGESVLISALGRISRAARRNRICVAFGMPRFEAGHRWNCAWVVGPAGELLTRHDELNPAEGGAFDAGLSTRSFWFDIKGIPSVVTLGREALWSELAEMAAIRGAMVHLHLANNTQGNGFDLPLMKQLFVNLASYRTLSATVNTASPESRGNPHSPAGGKSAIWEDLGRFTPVGVPVGYLGSQRYSAVRIAEAGVEEQLLCGSCTIEGPNRHYDFVTYHNPQMESWYQAGSQAIFRT